MNRLLSPEMGRCGVALQGTLVGKPQRKRGGIRDWPVYEKELLRLAKERVGRHVAVLVDYYAMPASWPGRSAASGKPGPDRGRQVEERLMAECTSALRGRFLPCVQLHEFESLLFADPTATAEALDAVGGVTSPSQLAADLTAVREGAGGLIEGINDHPSTAPSKRISALVPGYNKVAWGNAAAKRAGLETLRKECPWLDRWLHRLEGLNA